MQFEAAITLAAVDTFGSARAGNTQFWRDYQGKIRRHWRFENQEDLVQHLPPTTPLLAFLDQIGPRLSGLSSNGYRHVGLLEFLNWTGTVNGLQVHF